MVSYNGMLGYSDARAVGWVTIQGLSLDGQSYNGMLGYSDAGAVGWVTIQGLLSEIQGHTLMQGG